MTVCNLTQQSVYNCTDGHGDGDRVLITERPQLNYDVSANVSFFQFPNYAIKMLSPWIDL